MLTLQSRQVLNSHSPGSASQERVWASDARPGLKSTFVMLALTTIPFTPLINGLKKNPNEGRISVLDLTFCSWLAQRLIFSLGY